MTGFPRGVVTDLSRKKGNAMHEVFENVSPANAAEILASKAYAEQLEAAIAAGASPAEAAVIATANVLLER